MSDPEQRLLADNSPGGQEDGMDAARTEEHDRLPYIRRYHVDPLTGQVDPWSAMRRVRAFVLCRPLWYLRWMRGEAPYGKDLSPEFWTVVDDDRLADVQAELFLGWPRRLVRRLVLSLGDAVGTGRKGAAAPSNVQGQDELTPPAAGARP